MNVPVKLIKSQVMTDNFSFLQSLAKKYHKSSTKSKKISETTPLLDSLDQITFKEEVINWVFSLPFKDRIKALSIENKWLASMIHQMFLKFKIDSKVKFQIKNDTYNDEEILFSQYIGGIPNSTYPPYNGNSNELSLENFFNLRTEHYTREVCFSEKLFLNEIIFYSLRETNDSFGFSPDLVLDRKIFTYNFDHFTDSKCFTNYCSVTYDANMKMYTWNYPDWFKHKEFNSVAEFIVASLEQMLCVRYWYYKEEKEKLSKGINNNSFTITEDTVFNDLFENRNKLISYLKEEFSDKTLFKKLDMKKCLTDVKNDPSICNKIIKPTIDTRNYYYLYKQKHELIDPMQFESENDIVKKYTDSYAKGEQKLIDDLIFTSIEKLSSLEDFTGKNVHSCLMNMYAEKNANDLMLNLDEDKGKGKGKKRKSKAKASKIKETKEVKDNKETKINTSHNSNVVATGALSKCSSLGNNNKINSVNDDSMIKEHHKDTVILKVNDDYELTNISLTKDEDSKEHLILMNENSINNTSFPNLDSNKSKTLTKCKSFNNSNSQQNNQYVEKLVNSIMEEAIITYNPIDYFSDKKRCSSVNKINPIQIKRDEEIEIRKEKNDEANEDQVQISTPVHQHLSEPNTVPNVQKNKKSGKKENKPAFFLYTAKVNNNEGNSKKSKKGKKKDATKLTETTQSVTSTTVFNKIESNESAIDLIKPEPIKHSRTIQTNDSSKIGISIESTVTHEIIKSSKFTGNKKMIDNSCQTDLKKQENVIVNITSNVFETKEEKKKENSNTVSNNTQLELTGTSLNMNKTKSTPNSQFHNQFHSFNKKTETKKITEVAQQKNLTLQQPQFINSKKQIKDNDNKDKESSSINNQFNSKYEVDDNIFNSEINEQYPNSTSNKYQQQRKKNYNNLPYQTNYNSKPYQGNSNKYNNNYNQRSAESSKNFYKNDKNNYPNNMNNMNNMFNQFNKAYSFIQNPHLNNDNSINRPQHNFFIYNSSVNFNNSISLSNGNLSQEGFSSVTPTSSSANNTWNKKTIKESDNILKKINFEEFSPCTYSHKLHNDILDYSSNVKKVLDTLRPIKEFIIKVVNLIIKSSTDKEYETELYGSYATDLSIESSDVDILIKVVNENFDPESVINKICISLASFKMFDNITPIATASIPVIKLCIDPEKLFANKNPELTELIEENKALVESYNEFLSSDIAKNYNFNIDELTKIKLDLSFYNVLQLGENNVVEYIKNQIRINPEITPLIHVLKRYLSLNRLNSSFNGGLSSFSLLLMIIAYVRYPKTNNISNLGSMLMGFLEFFGKYFNFNQFVIDVSNFK